ncbi:magnesium-translocating P-type ATPase [Anaeromyxobacter oryzae]|uniref:magnesium-translocating P-type ATPase n=1 Tax=Anaeromyxobacter oryzae TaxID=2918170 RepID=UPI0020BDF204|nr:magnesium-translocating P-type ATPase [Anaeromyxobacter oryzae]
MPALLEELGTSARGLSTEEASRRSSTGTSTRLRRTSRARGPRLFLHQFENPIAALLLVAAILAFFLGDRADAAIILAIVLVSGFLGFWQERKAAHAVEQLLAMVRPKATVLRDGVERQVAPEEVVPGDVVLLSPGDNVPGDGRLLTANDLFVDEAALTGESYPVAKAEAALSPDAPLARRTDAVFLGSHVVSGSAVAVIVKTGRDTDFGAISERLRLRPPETEFERGVRRFGYLLLEITLLLVLAIFAFNVAFHRPTLDSFLFALALAVGLTPQLLPGIISVNLAHGARRMAASKVIVRRLSSIENFGSMEVLCCDKTGTLTEGVARVHSAVSMTGEASERTLLYAYLNSSFEKGYDNPIDRAIREHARRDISGWRKLGEKPYDFSRKRLSVLLGKDGEALLVTKGAVPNVLGICTTAEGSDGVAVPLESALPIIQSRFQELSARGLRVLGVAYRTAGLGQRLVPDDEAGMTFLGFVVLHDPVKQGVADIIRQLRELGVSLKVITGDNRWVAQTLGRQVGVNADELLTGAELHDLSEAGLIGRVAEVDLFAEIEPAQKDRIILAVKKAGHVVGFIGDGINDASALHVADVGISVDSAVDVAKEAADIVLLEKDLGVLATGVREGRATFANTMKYVLMATSSNFGNMFSMAGASLLLPFLPLLPSQILLMNLLTDLPEMFIASDRVDAEMTARPHRWDIRFIRRFMLLFGLVSSVSDYLTFGLLLVVLGAPERLFRTGWFVESVVSATLIVLVVRTRHPLHRSRPGRPLLTAALAVVLATLALPYLPGAEFLGFQHLPPPFYPALGAIILVYVLSAEIAKRWFYRGDRDAAGVVPRSAALIEAPLGTTAGSAESGAGTVR